MVVRGPGRVWLGVAGAAMVLAVWPGSVARPSADSLARDVLIRRDTFGVPHLLAESEEAAAFGLGYAQAEDHPVELLTRILRARGGAAKLLGPSELENDVAMARFDNVRQAREALTREVGKSYRKILEAYAAGVNHYVSQHRNDLPSWTREMGDIHAADVLANSRAGAVQSAAGGSLAAQLRRKFETGLPQAQDARRVMDVPSMEAPVDELREADGSNALAIAGSRSASGKPILMGNPHLRWQSLYWEAHITVPGRINFYGSTLVGIPTLRAGFNDRLGYVQTNNDPDLEDVFALPIDPASPDRYRIDGRSRDLKKREVTVEVRQPDGAITKERREFWESHLGPIVYRTKTHAFALHSESLRAWRYFEGFQELMPSRTLADFQARLRRSLVPTSNFTYADADGHVLYQWNARLPRRVADGTDYELDVPGDTAKYIWNGIHPVDDLPRLLDPRGGYIQNANNSPWWTSMRDRLDPASFPSYVERNPLALRPQRALQMLEARETFTVDDVRALKFDTHVLLADRVLPDLLEAVRAAPAQSTDLAEGAALLSGWNRKAESESEAAALFFTFWDTYRASRTTAVATGTPATPEQLFAKAWDEKEPLTTPSGLADRQAAATALEGAVRALRERHGSARVKWGEINRLRAGDIDLPADGADGSYGLYHVQRFDPLPGSKTVRIAGPFPDMSALPPAASPSGSPLLAGFGDAWVLLVHFTDPVEAHGVLAYGQTTRADSAHSRDQLRLFAGHQLRRIIFTEADIKANLERSYRP